MEVILVEDDFYANMPYIRHRYNIHRGTIFNWKTKGLIREHKKNDKRIFYSLDDIDNCYNQPKKSTKKKSLKSWIIKVYKKDIFWTPKGFSENLQDSKVYTSKSGCKKAMSTITQKNSCFVKENRIVFVEVVIYNKIKWHKSGTTLRRPKSL